MLKEPPPPEAAEDSAEPSADAAAPPIKVAAARGVGWTGLSHGVRVGVTLLTTYILAWQVGAAAFGLVAGATIVVGFLMILKDLGTGAALVQVKELRPEVLRSVFWANTILGCLGALALYGVAPFVAAFFVETNVTALTEVLRALAWMLVLAGLGVTHQSLLQRELRFALLAKIEIASTSVAAVVSIALAFAGAGVWALVFQALSTMALSTGLAVAFQGWRPSWGMRLAELRSVSRFSLNLTGFQLLNYCIRNVDQLLILKVLGETQVGVYALATRILLFPLSSINAVLSRVLFPLFSRIQDDVERFRNAYLKIISGVATLAFPAILGVAVVADPLVAVGLPAEWQDMAGLLSALAVVGLIQCVVSPVGNIYLARGRTDVQLRWGLISGVSATSAFCLGIQWGAVGVAWSYAIIAVLLFPPGVILPLRLIDTSFREFLAALVRPGAAAALMGGAVLAVGEVTRRTCAPAMDLTLRIAVGVSTYLLVSWFCNMQLVNQVRQIIRAARA